ncbi:MAG: aldo/keto reductase [Verrucomicrobiae bacterium]|nr:aldo/keto reductase [Verrucomicrobiae bacterium]
MITRRFGRTNLDMPVFSCGGMRYQQSWTDDPWDRISRESQENVEACVHRSLALGINHIETARGYGSSEIQLGRILPKLPRGKLIVQTKVTPFPTAREFRETFETSMERLRLDHVDLLSLHGINNAELLDWSLRKGGCLEEARKIQREGRCRFIGFSTHATEGVITQACASGEFDYVNLHWYFVNDLNWPSVVEAKKQDMGVFIISPNDKGGKLYAPPPLLRDLCQPLTPMQFNDLYCLCRDEVHTLSLGAAKPSDFDEHIEALKFYDIRARMVAPIETRLRTEMANRLGQLWCERWTEGLPEYTEAPAQVNIKEILRLSTYARGLDLVDWGKMRYNLLSGGGGHWFPGEMAREPHHYAQALEKSPFAEEIPGLLTQAHELFFDAPAKRLSQS